MTMIRDKAEEFRQTLLYEISVGRYPAGGKLPSERTFSEIYQISRTTARRALNRLQEEKIIIRKPPVGAFVSPKAVEFISKQASGRVSLSVALLMPASQLRNPHIENIVTTCRRYLDSDIQISIVVQDTDYPFSLQGGKADLILMHALPVDERVERLQKQTDCLVLLNRVDPKYNYISADNFTGGKIMASHLIQKGHTSLGFLGMPGGTGSDFGDRRRGIEDVCAGVSDIRLEKLTFSSEDSCQFESQGSRVFDKAVGRLLKKLPEITAIMASYDYLAMHLFQALYRKGLRVPDDISVIGFDDHYFAQFCQPALTTVKYPAETLGITLAEFIKNYRDHGQKEIRQVVLPLLVERRNGTVKAVG